MALGHELGIKIVPKSGFPLNSLRMKKVNIVKADPSEGLPIIASQGFSIMDVDSDVMVLENPDAPSAGAIMVEASLERPAPALFPQFDPAALTSNTQYPTSFSCYPDEKPPPMMTTDPADYWAPMVVTDADLEGLIRMASDPSEVSEQLDGEIPNNEEDICDTKSSWLGGVEKEDFEEDDADESQRRRVATKRVTPVKEDMQFLLVHGDVLLLSGDDFDYGIERKGMGLCKYPLGVIMRQMLITF